MPYVSETYQHGETSTRLLRETNRFTSFKCPFNPTQVSVRAVTAVRHYLSSLVPPASCDASESCRRRKSQTQSKRTGCVHAIGRAWLKSVESGRECVSGYGYVLTHVQSKTMCYHLWSLSGSFLCFNRTGKGYSFGGNRIEIQQKKKKKVEETRTTWKKLRTRPRQQ